jgi:hypothetical protein
VTKKKWDLLFPLVLMGYRISVQASVGHCPFKLMHGRDPVLPISFKDFASELDINEKLTGASTTPRNTSCRP